MGIDLSRSELIVEGHPLSALMIGEGAAENVVVAEARILIGSSSTSESIRYANPSGSSSAAIDSTAAGAIAGQQSCPGFRIQGIVSVRLRCYDGRVKTNLTAAAQQMSRTTSFRLFLQQELARRCSRNSQYSLRSFALQVDKDHSTLSQLLRGKRPMTEKTIEQIGSKLGLERDLIDSFIAREKLAGPHDAPLAEVQQLTQDTAELVSDVYHYTILELVRLAEFKPDSRWIARVLGISTDEVNVALNRLIRLGLLSMEARDRWVDKSGDTAASFDEFTGIAIQRLSEQVRRLFMAALRETPPEYRAHSSTTMAVNTARLPAALELITKFRRELADSLESGDGCDEVYQLEISLFPISNVHRNRT